MTNRNISIIGLPAAGKTTYIAALWGLMMQNSQYCSMTLHSLKEGNQEYLNKISEDWISFKEVGRTKLANVGDVVMNLKSTQKNEILTLNIPDFYGELFDAHFKDREWTKEYYELMRASNRFILFVDPHAENNIARTIMNELEDMEQFADLDIDIPKEDTDVKTSEDVTKIDSSETSVINPQIYQHINTSNQVKLVEILQYIMYTLEPEMPFKVAIIVSKWDKVTANFPNALPEEIFKRHLPLLYQFLQCNSQAFNYNIFGVSAQGGDYETKENLDELINKMPEDRVVIFDGQTNSKDIATPITWLTQ
jgi:hypothetical protein